MLTMCVHVPLWLYLLSVLFLIDTRDWLAGIRPLACREAGANSFATLVVSSYHLSRKFLPLKSQVLTTYVASSYHLSGKIVCRWLSGRDSGEGQERKTVSRPFLLSSSHRTHGNFCLCCLCCLPTSRPTVLFFKTTETIQDNINDRDNFFGLTTDLGLTLKPF